MFPSIGYCFQGRLQSEIKAGGGNASERQKKTMDFLMVGVVGFEPTASWSQTKGAALKNA